MKVLQRVALTMLVLVFQGCGAPQQKSVGDEELGLDKNSVFDTPDPIVASVSGGEPGENQRTGGYFSEAPPTIPHQIDGFLPIRTDDNQCLNCHDDQSQIGEPVAAGDPTPIPASHYTDLRRNPNEVTQALIGARHVCVQCHVPQHDATPLVQNTYQQ